MLIKLKTGFMRYEPCDLSLREDQLCLRANDWEKSFPLSSLSAAALIKDKRTTQRLELDIGATHLEAIVPQESAQALADFLTDITQRKGRVDLRLDISGS